MPIQIHHNIIDHFMSILALTDEVALCSGSQIIITLVVLPILSLMSQGEPSDKDTYIYTHTLPK